MKGKERKVLVCPFQCFWASLIPALCSRQLSMVPGLGLFPSCLESVGGLGEVQDCVQYFPVECSALEFSLGVVGLPSKHRSRVVEGIPDLAA
jgi:hypothetical protein